MSFPFCLILFFFHSIKETQSLASCQPSIKDHWACCASKETAWKSEDNLQMKPFSFCYSIKYRQTNYTNNSTFKNIFFGAIMMLKLIQVILLEIKIIGNPGIFSDVSKTIPNWNICTSDPEIKTSGIAHH